LSSVTVNPYTTETRNASITTNGTFTYTPVNADALSEVTVDVSINTVNNQAKTANSSTVQQSVTPDNGYTGLSSVTIEPYVLDTKTVDSSTVSQTITSDEDGLSSVTVNPYVLDSKTVDSSTVSQTITSDEDGLSSVTVNPYTTETDSSTLTANGQYVFTPTNADALSQVTVDVSINTVNNQNKTVDSSTVSQSITADNGYTGLGTVTVNPYTTESDSSTLTANGQYVFAPTSADALSQVTVDVSVDATPNLQPKVITATTTFPAVILPDPGYDGFSEIDIDIQGVDYDCNSTLSDASVQDSSTYNVYAYVDHINILSKMVDPVTVDSSTVSQTINPVRDAISQVTVNPYTTETKSATLTANGIYTYSPTSADALSQVTIDVSINTAPTLQSKTVNSSTSQQSVQADSGYDGLSQVIVNRYVLDSKTVDSSTVSQTVTSDEDGLSSVTVNPYTVEADSSTLTANGHYEFAPANADALSKVEIDVSINTVNNQSKTADSSTVSQAIIPDNGYTGLSSVTINPYTTETDTSTLTANGRYEFLPQNADTLASVVVDVSVDTVNNQSKTVDSSTVGQTVSPDYNLGYTGLGKVDVNPYVLDTSTVNPSTNAIIVTSAVDGLSQVTVNAVSNAIDSNITAGNIRDGVTILGVSGTYAGNNQSKTVDSSTVAQSITPDQGYTGLGKVDINPYTTEAKNASISANGTYTYIPTSADALREVVIDVSIKTAPTLQSKTVDSSTSQQAVQADNGYDGLSQVVINPYVLDSKTVDSSTVSQTVTSSEDGLSSVTVNPYTTETDSSTLTANGTYVFTPTNADALSQVTVDVSINTVRNQNKTVDSSTDRQYITADTGYTGLGTVTIMPYTLYNPDLTIYMDYPYTVGSYTTVRASAYSNDGFGFVSWKKPKVKSKTVDASTVQQTFNPNDEQYSYYTSVTVNAVTSSIDQNIAAGNIKDGVTILGVTGTYEGAPADYDTIYAALLEI